MTYARDQMLRFMILPRVCGDIPNCFAVPRHVPPDSTMDRIWRTFSVVSFLARQDDDVASRRPDAAACMVLAWLEHHCKFVERLLALSKSRWFTVLSSALGVSKNAAATSRCTFRVSTMFVFERLTCKYPARSGVWSKTRPRLSAVLYLFFTQWSRLRTRPRELTSYRPSYPAIDFHVSMPGIISC